MLRSTEASTRKPPGESQRWRWSEHPSCIQANEGGDTLEPTYPKGLHPGAFYAPLTHLAGEDPQGDPLSHTRLFPYALKVFGPELRARWLYDGNKWIAAFVPHHIGVEPCQGTSQPAKRLAELIQHRIGGEWLDIGQHYVAEVLVKPTLEGSEFEERLMEATGFL